MKNGDSMSTILYCVGGPAFIFHASDACFDTKIVRGSLDVQENP